MSSFKKKKIQIDWLIYLYVYLELINISLLVSRDRKTKIPGY